MTDLSASSCVNNGFIADLLFAQDFSFLMGIILFSPNSVYPFTSPIDQYEKLRAIIFGYWSSMAMCVCFPGSEPCEPPPCYQLRRHNGSTSLIHYLFQYPWSECALWFLPKFTPRTMGREDSNQEAFFQQLILFSLNTTIQGFSFIFTWLFHLFFVLGVMPAGQKTTSTL